MKMDKKRKNYKDGKEGYLPMAQNGKSLIWMIYNNDLKEG